MINIEEGLILAILDNKISFKEKGSQFFSGNWEDSDDAAESLFNKRLEKIKEYFIVKEEQVYYPAIERYRREVILLKRIRPGDVDLKED